MLNRKVIYIEKEFNAPREEEGSRNGLVWARPMLARTGYPLYLAHAARPAAAGRQQAGVGVSSSRREEGEAHGVVT